VSSSTPRLVVVTDLPAVGEAELRARIEAVAPRASEVVVLLRDRTIERDARRRLAQQLRALTWAVGARLVVAADLELARAVGADGLHLPSVMAGELARLRATTPPGFVLSAACHDHDELEHAARNGADFALYSPIFASPGKGPALGVDALREARAHLGDAALGLVALGGIDDSNASACLAAGAAGVAAIRADLSAWLLALG
jgi:thiamine-phosphate pyrophosphorylase